ncbi:hypothetical protein MMC29_003484 [Sticta canariensis]|nr:hypothetical protein [Sticta canariensis]
MGWYVEELKIHRLFSRWGDSDSDAEPESPPDEAADEESDSPRGEVAIDDERAIYRKAIQDCDYVSTGEYENWYEVLETGKDDAVLALLVTLLPNLRRLDIQFKLDDGILFLQTIRRISAASSPQNSRAPLSRLREVTVKTCDDFIDVRCLWPFFLLPSLRFVAGISVDHNEMIPLPERSSDIVQVYWVQPTGLTPEKTKNLFGIFKALQIFRFLPECTECTTDWDVMTIRDSLILYANHTLKELSLYIDDLHDAYQENLGGLRAFEVLKKIEISADLLLGERGPFRKTLAEVLPISIEDVTIQDYRLPRPEYRSLVINLVRVKHRSVPNLKRLSLQESFFNPCVIMTEEDLKMACQKAGFVLVISRDIQSGYGCFKVRVQSSSRDVL